VYQDVVDGARIGEALPHVDFIMSMFLPSDVPIAKDVRQMEAMLLFSRKPIAFVTYAWEGVPEIVEMAEVSVGGAETLRNKPTAICYINVTTAFNHNVDALRKLMYLAAKHLPCIYLPAVNRGLTCPITMAGAMACANAGQLVGLLLAQLASEGAPVVLHAAEAGGMDMKTMAPVYVAPEGKMYGLEMNHYYNLPTFSAGGVSDSKLLDEQAVMEASLSLCLAMLRGGNMIHDLGYLESGLTGSLELLVILDEIVSWMKAAMKGLEINQETLAMDIIHKHALAGDFLQTDHTLRHVREAWEPRLVDRQNLHRWAEQGATSMRTRAKARIEEILGAESRPVLPPEVEKKIRRISDKAAAR
jgi:trimethylamine--corrinoid protein Co-methyltransferase